MRRFFLLSALMLTFGIGFSQRTSFDERLLKKYTAEEISAMSIETLRFNTYCIENATIVMEMPSEKTGDRAISGARNVSDLTKINFFELNIELKEDEYQYFQLLGTNKLLAVKPISLIKTEIK